MCDSWLPTLHADTSEGGFNLSVKMSRIGMKVTRPSAEVNGRLCLEYAENPERLIASPQLIAINFQTDAAANGHWKEPESPKRPRSALAAVEIAFEDYLAKIGDRTAPYRAASAITGDRDAIYSGSYLCAAPLMAWPEVTFVDTDRKYAHAVSMRDAPGQGARFPVADYTEPLPEASDRTARVLISPCAGPCCRTAVATLPTDTSDRMVVSPEPGRNPWSKVS